MRNTNKAFTLVELIVVITILAILGTIAFISLQGYTGEAKNSKVTSDLRNIASAIETSSTRNNIVLLDVVSNTGSATANQVTGNFGGTGSSSGTLNIGTNYKVGNVDFAALEQNGEDFKDPNAAEGTDYLFGVVTTGEFKSYQLAGQIIENDVKKARINGTYYEVDEANDVDGLIEASAKNNTDTNGLVNNGEIGIGDSFNLY